MKKNNFIALKKIIQEKIVAKNGQPFAVFDFDNTCIINDIGEATFAYLCRNGLLRNKKLLAGKKYNDKYNRLVFLKYHNLLKQGKIKEAYMFCAKAFAGFTPKEAQTLTLKAIKTEGKNIYTSKLYGVSIAHGLDKRMQIKKIMDFLIKKNISIWIISASPEFAVQTAMQYYHIPGKVIGLKNKIKNKVFTTVLEKPLPILEGKVACIKKYINNRHSPLLAAGDSLNDLSMLEVATIKIVIERGNALTKIARSRNWFLFSNK